MVLREKVSDQNPLRKIARGTVNATLGWTEIPRQMIKVNKESGDIAGAFWGPLKGFAFFIGRTAVGVYEVTTFLLPPYKPVVNPEFILSDDNATDNE
jgi:putative exosortase-associated protein (TIGR04073 family)